MVLHKVLEGRSVPLPELRFHFLQGVKDRRVMIGSCGQVPKDHWSWVRRVRMFLYENQGSHPFGKNLTVHLHNTCAGRRVQLMRMVLGRGAPCPSPSRIERGPCPSQCGCLRVRRSGTPCRRCTLKVRRHHRRGFLLGGSLCGPRVHGPNFRCSDPGS